MGYDIGGIWRLERDKTKSGISHNSDNNQTASQKAEDQCNSNSTHLLLWMGMRDQLQCHVAVSAFVMLRTVYLRKI